jgi:hypothetical protein
MRGLSCVDAVIARDLMPLSCGRLSRACLTYIRVTCIYVTWGAPMTRGCPRGNARDLGMGNLGVSETWACQRPGRVRDLSVVADFGLHLTLRVREPVCTRLGYARLECIWLQRA